MTNEKEKPTRYDLIDKLHSIFDQLELAREKEAQSLKEGSERASNKLVLELWSRFLQLNEEAISITQDLMPLNPHSSLDEALECLHKLSSCAYDSIRQSPDPNKEQGVLSFDGSIQTFTEKHSILLKKLKCLSRRLGKYYWRRVLSKYLWTIACTLERYALDAIEDEDPSSVYSFSDPVVGVERPMNSLLEYTTRAENVSKWVSHSLAKETLTVLAELRQQLSNVKNRIMKSIAIGGFLSSSVLPAKRVMCNSFQVINKDYYGRLKDLSIEFQLADGVGCIEHDPTETIEDKAYHNSYWWTKLLTEDETEFIEKRYGPVANTLPELAELIREADRNSKSDVDSVGTHLLMLWDGPDIDQIRDDNALSQDTYKAVIRAHVSARKLRPKIEMVVGPEQAARFYDDLQETLAFGSAHDPKRWKWAGGAGKAEGIARSVEQWHRNLVLLTQREPQSLKQENKNVKEPAERTETKQYVKPAEKQIAENWSQITIEVVDNDTIKYKVDNKKWERANYTQLGFLDMRANRPNKLWPIFLGLARKTLPSNINKPKMKPKDIDRIRDTLREFFDIKDLPIRHDSGAKEYRCNFKFNDPRDWIGTMQNENLVD